MTISRTVYNQLFENSEAKEQVIRLRPTEAKAGAVVMSSSKNRIQMWTNEEHERFLEALERYPSGPWKKIADHIGTKTPRQTMTHAQKYRQKIYRRQRGLRNQRRPGGYEKGVMSPNAVSDLAKHGQGMAETHAHSRLDILAHSAAVAQSTQTPPRDYALQEYSQEQFLQQQQQAYGRPAQGPAPYLAEQAAQQAYAARMEMARKTVSTLQPPAAPAATASPPKPSTPNVYASSNLCANSHLPPLAEILHLRGSQVAQQ